jgi:hypothetical protein
MPFLSFFYQGIFTVDGEVPGLDWVPEDDTIVEDRTVHLQGELKITDGIDFTLRSSKLIFNMTEMGGIIVEEGCHFFVIDSSIDIYLNSTMPYFLNKGTTIIKNSTIMNIDVRKKGGIETIGGDIEVEGSTISSCKGCAIYCEGGYAVVKNSSIIGNHWNGISLNFSKGIIRDNLIKNNTNNGIEVFKSDVSVINNTVRNHHRDWDKGFGIFYNLSCGMIANNNLSQNSINILCARSNTTISENTVHGGYYGIQVSDEAGHVNNADGSLSDDDGWTSKGIIEDNIVLNQNFFSVQVFECHYDVFNNTMNDSWGTPLTIRGSPSRVERNTVSEIFCGFGSSAVMKDNRIKVLGAGYDSNVVTYDDIKFGAIHVTDYSSVRGMKYLDIEVKDGSGEHVPRADIHIYSLGEDFEYRGKTNEEGVIGRIPLVRFVKTSPDYASFVQRHRSFDPYRIYAVDGERAGYVDFDLENTSTLSVVIGPGDLAPDLVPSISSYKPVRNETINCTDTMVFNVGLVNPLPDDFTVKWYMNGNLVSTGALTYGYIPNSSSAGGYDFKVVISNGVITRSKAWTLWVTDPNDPYPLHIHQDLDRDQMKDEWEISCFGNLKQTQWDDTDRDGFSNYQEFKNDTDPMDRNDPVDRRHRPIFPLFLIVCNLSAAGLFVIIGATVIIALRKRRNEKVLQE